ncbi:MAG: S9 family peptidase [Bacteroidales bacterium]|jgi:dipeptidyl aminopeptidase/acylaminoacyl peptidase|nr:S9 family peptidase [Bacteroidales bacterium]
MKKTLFWFAILAVITISCSTEQNKVSVSVNLPDVNLTQEEINNGILTPEILWKFGRISSPQLSPDKNKIIYNITYYDLNENKGYTHIFGIPATGSEKPEQLTSGSFSCFNPRWTKDGKIIYLSTETGKSEIWTMNSNGKEKTKISDFDIDINSFDISPANEKLLFTADVKLDKTPQEIYPDMPKSNVIIADDLMYRHWNSWHDYAYSHIFVADYNQTSLNNITDIMKDEKYDSPLSPYFDESEIAWSTDGKKIAYTCKKLNGKKYAMSTDSDIYIYDLESGETKNITQGMHGYDKYPVFSPDSKKIAWLSMETPGYESDKDRLLIMDLESGEKTYLTSDFDYNVSNIVWPIENETDNIIYFIGGINATHQLFCININTREIKQITDGVHDYQSFTYNENSFIGMKMSMSMASELFAIDNTGKETQLTFTNKHIYDNIETCKVVEKWVTTTDNKKMLTWVILPPDFDETKKYPAILFCQGGPQSTVSQFFSYRWNFQLMASNGYVVIAPNRRGLPGFGSEWNAQISGDYGGQNMKDYISAVEAIKTEPYVDENRIGAVGASYGGFSVFWLAGHNENKLFKAFISHCGMFNLESQYGATEELFFVNHDLGGPYWDKNNKIAQNTYANSPHRFVQNWNTPILIFAGENDFRIPYTESLQAFNCARLNDVESRLVLFPEETHFVLKPQNSIVWQREFKAWLDKHLKN